MRDVMSVSPVTIPPSMSVHEAHTLMQQCKVRHLPVLQDGCLVGIVSDRDIRLVLPSPATSLAVWEIRHLLGKLTVGEMMTCPSSFPNPPVPRPSPQGTHEARPSPILHCLSRLR